jgi:site-specific DNA recombinase
VSHFGIATHLTDPDKLCTLLRKAYIQAVVDRVEVDDHTIRIIDDKATLEQVVAGRTSTAAGVRSFVRKWRARRDSNS